MKMLLMIFFTFFAGFVLMSVKYGLPYSTQCVSFAGRVFLDSIPYQGGEITVISLDSVPLYHNGCMQSGGRFSVSFSTDEPLLEKETRVALSCDFPREWNFLKKKNLTVRIHTGDNNLGDLYFQTE